MRILIAATAAAGHVNPLRPLATAARDAGHDVTWATGAAICRDLADEGFATRGGGTAATGADGCVGRADARAARRRGPSGTDNPLVRATPVR